MVSLGDTAISLHILQPPREGGGVLGSVRSDLDSGKKINGGGGCSGRSDLESGKNIRVSIFRGAGGRGCSG